MGDPKNKEVLTTGERLDQATSEQIRGGSMLVLGKIIQAGLLFGTQVLMVRYLSKADYGAWGYAWAVLSFFRTFSTLGLKRSVTRFVPIFHEKGEYQKISGMLVLIAQTIAFIGIGIILLVYLSPNFISRLIAGSVTPTEILLIMIFFVPLDAVDEILIGLFASFASPKFIFYNKYLMAPGLRFLVVLFLVLSGSSVLAIAYGYVLVSLFGVAFYSAIFVWILQKKNILQKLRSHPISIPYREVFSFTLPLLTSDLILILLQSSNTVILGYYHGTTAVASLQVILQAAMFTQMVTISFSYLYTPLASRLFARRDKEVINKLYWKTAMWMSIISLPIFLLTFSSAITLVPTVYGERYTESWIFLSMLSTAYFTRVIFGFNGLTIQVYGKVKFIMLIDLFTAIINIIANFIFVPPFGAMGAAAVAAFSIILHTLLKHLGLSRITGISPIRKENLWVYLQIFVAALVLFVIHGIWHIHLVVSVLLIGIISLVIFKSNQHRLEVKETFPELFKIPFIKTLLYWNIFSTVESSSEV